MMRLCRAFTIAALCVLASAATAYAECARVLWQHITFGANSQVTTEPVDGHPTRPACGAAIKAVLDTVEASRSETMLVTVDRTASSVVTLVKTKTGKVEPFSSFSLLCLPDTVDPRGPKGK
jgi:hypothetical protein